MKIAVSFASALVALLALSLAPLASPTSTSTTSTPVSSTTPKPGNTTKVDPPGRGERNGTVVVNGNYQGDYPQHAGSAGSARLRNVQGSPTNTAVTTDNGFRGEISNLEAGDTVSMSVNNHGTISGNGGTITLSGRSTVTVTNTAAVGSGSNMTVNMPGGSITIPPGVTIPVVTN